MGRKFYRALKDLAEKLGCTPHDLLAVIYFESACKPDAFNKLTSAVGLLQFLPSTLKGLGYSGNVFQFQQLCAWQQLPYIEKYLLKIVDAYGSLTSLDRLYRAVLYPVSLTKGDDDHAVVFVGGSSEFAANKNLDVDADGVITVGDIRRVFEGVVKSKDYDKYLTEMFWEGSPYPPDIIAEVALRYVDVGNSLDSSRYLEIMGGPQDKDAAMTRYLLAGPSTCALFARGVWRVAGVEHGILSSPYRIGRAVSDIVEIARDHNAWHPNPNEIKQGDVFLLGPNEHVVVVITEPYWADTDKIRFDTCEGGQAPNSSFVRRFTRTLTWENGKWYTGGNYKSHVMGRADACELLT